MATRTHRTGADSRPVSNANFLVDLGLGDLEAPKARFVEVLLPLLRSNEGGANAKSYTVELA